MDQPPEAGPTPTSVPNRCPWCGYDLRGSASPRCPECGAAKTWRRLLFFDRRQLYEAAHTLSRRGVPYRMLDPDAGAAGLAGMLAGFHEFGEIRIGQPDVEAALAALDRHGIAAPLPVVDPAEPLCPSCGAAIDPAREDSCEACGTVIQWVDTGDTGPVDAKTPAPRPAGNTAKYFVAVAAYGVLALPVWAALLGGAGVALHVLGVVALAAGAAALAARARTSRRR